MLISTRSRYGLRALTTMIALGWRKPVALSELSRIEEVSQRYLEQIFIKLRANGIVKGRRGPGGGYVLSRDPSRISLLDVIGVLEAGFLAPECVDDAPGCAVGSRSGRKKCDREETCITRRLWLVLRNCCYHFLDSNSLADLAEGRISTKDKGNVEVL